MSDERLLQDLAQRAIKDRQTERERLDERWDRLSHGELSADEEAELRALAEGSDDIGDAYDAFRPLDADFRERVLNAVLEPTAASESEPFKAPRAKVLPFRRRAQQIGGWLAAAAALVLVVTRLGGPEVEPLPRYQLELSGGKNQVRSGDEPAEEPIFAAGNELKLILRTQTAVSGELEARFFLGPPSWGTTGGELRPWMVTPEIASTGNVQVSGRLGKDFDLEPGEWTLLVVVGRRGSLPDSDTLQELQEQEIEPLAGDGWLAEQTPLRVVSAP